MSFGLKVCGNLETWLHLAAAVILGGGHSHRGRNPPSSRGCPMGTLRAELAKDEGGRDRDAADVMAILIDWVEDQFRQLGSATHATSPWPSSPVSRVPRSSQTRAATPPSSLARHTTSNAGSTRSRAHRTSHNQLDSSRLALASWPPLA